MPIFVGNLVTCTAQAVFVGKSSLVPELILDTPEEIAAFEQGSYWIDEDEPFTF